MKTIDKLIYEIASWFGKINLKLANSNSPRLWHVWNFYLCKFWLVQVYSPWKHFRR